MAQQRTEPNSGKWLEEMVQRIEQILAPAGAIARGEILYDENGVQIAQFDVCIRGPVGSSTINWLIECRDRPSEGAAPRSWIEQMVTRREEFHFDKAFAVSTQGFSPAARDLANKRGIILRTVAEIQDMPEGFVTSKSLLYLLGCGYHRTHRREDRQPAYPIGVFAYRRSASKDNGRAGVSAYQRLYPSTRITLTTTK